LQGDILIMMEGVGNQMGDRSISLRLVSSEFDQGASPLVTTVANWQRGPAWKCSDMQKGLILKLVDEHQLEKPDVEALVVERFGKGVRVLNKVEDSGLIDELLDTHGGSPHVLTPNRRDPLSL
jgi:hypothetical protein